jgi:hypothetical protein
VRGVPRTEIVADELRRLAQEAQRAVADGVDATRAWLATPNGRRFRQVTARVLLVATPFVFRHRFFRSTWTGRLIELTGGTAVLIKLAEAIRDWDPELQPTSVVEVGEAAPRRRA